MGSKLQMLLSLTTTQKKQQANARTHARTKMFCVSPKVLVGSLPKLFEMKKFDLFAYQDVHCVPLLLYQLL